MVFSSPLFLFIFLPVTIAGYLIVGKSLRNPFLLMASLIFYAWGEPRFLPVLLFATVFNYLMGILIDNNRQPLHAKLLLYMAVVTNLSLLIYFKYTNFLLGNLNVVLGFFNASIEASPEQHLPIGISFFTFGAIAYVVDVYRQENAAQRNPLRFALFMTFFPKITAGPIARYDESDLETSQRSVDLDALVCGIQRFIVGLGKKVLIANTLAKTADQIFAIPPGQATAGLAWLGIIAYTLQIYFDFSGYSDMAIGIGRMFGFNLPENFNYPYISTSITDFWRRWHISLSSWFKDYLFLPLIYALMTDKIRRKIAEGRYPIPYRTHFSLLLVFSLCGLWHGASWNFLVWGFLHGLFLVLETLKFGKLLKKSRAPLQYAYTLLVLVVSWVFFRTHSLTEAVDFLQAMLGLTTGVGSQYTVGKYVDVKLVLALICATLGATPLLPGFGRYLERFKATGTGLLAHAVSSLAPVSLALVFLLSLMSLASETYQPFIYLRF